MPSITQDNLAQLLATCVPFDMELKRLDAFIKQLFDKELDDDKRKILQDVIIHIDVMKNESYRLGITLANYLKS